MDDSAFDSPVAKRAGFTLMEVLVAVALSSVIMIALFGVFDSVVKVASDVKSQEMDAYGDRILESIMFEDLRSVFTGKGEDFSFSGNGGSFLGSDGELMEFCTTASLTSVGEKPSFSLQRVVYALEGNSDEKTLVRREKTVLWRRGGLGLGGNSHCQGDCQHGGRVPQQEGQFLCDRMERRVRIPCGCHGDCRRNQQARVCLSGGFVPDGCRGDRAMIPSGRDGSVLIVVLLILAAAAYLIMESGKVLRIDYEGAAFHRLSVSGGSLLHAGVFAAKELLVKDLKQNGKVDHRFDSWAKADTFFENISKKLESGELSGEISAEDGKISLNSFRLGNGIGDATGKIFTQLLLGLVMAHNLEARPSDYLTSIKIWLGAKDTQSDGAWYASRDLGYQLKKGGQLFRTPEELRLVRWKGVSEEDKKMILDGAGGVPGLLEFVTVWGQGRINVNLAPREIVAAMCFQSDFREDFVQSVEAYRSNGENQFGISWINTVAGTIGIKEQAFPSKGLDVASSAFRISLAAKVGAGTIRSTTIVKREGQQCVVLLENIH